MRAIAPIPAKGYSERIDMARDIRTLQSSARHIQEMIQRLHQQTQDIVLREEPVDLEALAEELLAGMTPRLAGYRLKTQYSIRSVISGDPAHIAETIANIVANAVEAMPQGGELSVRLFETKRGYYLRIKDNGPGIVGEQLKTRS